ncbi:MFS transporter [Micromonospora sp. DPT]|uniref:MFS transporter n=1 Tax=Micromonospora sp. DPT TaxID=3142975 RepID=UPI003208D2D1
MSTAVRAPATVRPGVTLAAVCLAVLVLPASLTGASVALPDIAVDLKADLVPLQWVVNSYNLAFACFMLACGSIADIVGRRRMFTAGTVLFGLASLASALTSDILLLDVVRALAGLGAAAVMTAGSAILATAFQGAALARAFGVLGASAGAGLALGPSSAGLLVGQFGWRAVFLSHLVVAAVVLLAVRVMPESRDPGAATVDTAGTLTFTLSLFLLMLGVVEGPQWGWASPSVIGLLVGAAVLLAAFVLIERRVRRPMLDLSLFRQPRFMALCLVPVALAFGFVCLLVFLPSYFTGVTGASSKLAGALMMLLTLPVLFVPLLVGRLVKRGLSTRAVLSASLLLVGAGCAWLTVIGRDTATLAVAAPMVLVGVGMGVSAGLVDGVAITSVEPERAGMAAGMFNTMRLASEALAIAVMGAVLVSLTQTRVSDGIDRFGGADADEVARIGNSVASGDLDTPAAGVAAAQRPDFLDFLADSYTDAFRVMLWILAAVTVLSGVVVHLMLRARSAAPATPADASAAGLDGAPGDGRQPDLAGDPVRS